MPPSPSATPEPKDDSLNLSDRTQPLIGLAALMRMAFSGTDLAPLGTQLIERAQQDPDDTNAMMDLSTVLQLIGNRELALNVQAQALAVRQLYHRPAAVQPAAIRLLAIMGPGDLMSNTPLEFLLEDSDVALDLLYLTPDHPLPTELPDHDVAFFAIGECDDNHPLLAQAAARAQSWPRPVVNAPDRIRHLSRDGACALLRAVPGVEMPVTARIGRETLARLGHEEHFLSAVLEDGAFPLIVRPVGSHAGQGLTKLNNLASVAGYLDAMPEEEEFYLSRFVDYSGADGLFRKYRIAIIDGRPFVCHMAVSEHWMIHYLNAGMAESAEKRAEEAHCMATFDEGFAQRHGAALAAVNQRMGLDYLGIDCAETTDGKLLIFEVDSSMIVHAMDPVDLFPYKQPQMKKVFEAFRDLLEQRHRAAKYPPLASFTPPPVSFP